MTSQLLHIVSMYYLLRSKSKVLNKIIATMMSDNILNFFFKYFQTSVGGCFNRSTLISSFAKMSLSSLTHWF